MKLTSFILRIKDADGTYSVGAIDLETGTTLEAATEIAIDALEPGQLLERITNADTKEAASLQSIARDPKGFGQ
jgi:hypothetical protein